MINKPYVRLTNGILGTDTSTQASSLIQITYAIYHTFEEKQVHFLARLRFWRGTTTNRSSIGLSPTFGSVGQ